MHAPKCEGKNGCTALKASVRLPRTVFASQSVPTTLVTRFVAKRSGRIRQTRDDPEVHDASYLSAIVGSSVTSKEVGSSVVLPSVAAWRKAAVLWTRSGVSHASPMPLKLLSRWSGLATCGQLSSSSGMPSPSLSPQTIGAPFLTGNTYRPN